MILAVGWNRLKKRGPGLGFFLFQADAQVYTPRTGHAVVVWNHCFYLMGGQGFKGKEGDGFGTPKTSCLREAMVANLFFWGLQRWE